MDIFIESSRHAGWEKIPFTETEILNKVYHLLVSSSQPLFNSIRVYTHHINVVVYLISMSWGTLHFGSTLQVAQCHDFFLQKKASTNGSPSNSQSNANEAGIEIHGSEGLSVFSRECIPYHPWDWYISLHLP